MQKPGGILQKEIRKQKMWPTLQILTNYKWLIRGHNSFRDLWKSYKEFDRLANSTTR